MLHFGHVIEHYGAICHNVPPTRTTETKYVHNVHVDVYVCVFWSFWFYERFEICVICFHLKYKVNYNTFVAKTST
jgi:hypothetical protein